MRPTRSRALSKSSPEQLEAPVLIAGAGIGGLACALALAREGIASHVLERRPAFAEEGAGIQIGPNGTRILRELGVADVLRPNVGTPESLRVFDGTSGRHLASLPLGAWIEARHGAPYWTAHRNDLHAALLDRVRAEDLIGLTLGFSVSEASTRSDHVTVAAADGRAARGRVLVGADGLWSNVRDRVVATAAPEPFGRSAARTVVPAAAAPAELRTPSVGLWLAPDAHIVHYPVRGGSELALVVIVADREPSEAWGLDVESDWIADRTRHFPAPVRELLSAGASWRKWALRTLPELPHWTEDRVALIGDAAHPVLPFLAQGAVLALEDAVTLAARLARNADVPAALADYERARKRRAAQVAAASQRNGRIYHLAGPLAFARNATMGLAPPSLVMAGFDWLYGWRT